MKVVADESWILILAGEQTVAVHPLIAPGEVSILDDHYGDPQAAGPGGAAAVGDRAGVPAAGTGAGLLACRRGRWGEQVAVGARGDR